MHVRTQKSRKDSVCICKLSSDFTKAIANFIVLVENDKKSAKRSFVLELWSFRESDVPREFFHI